MVSHWFLSIFWSDLVQLQTPTEFGLSWTIDHPQFDHGRDFKEMEVLVALEYLLHCKSGSPLTATVKRGEGCRDLLTMDDSIPFPGRWAWLSQLAVAAFVLKLPEYPIVLHRLESIDPGFLVQAQMLAGKVSPSHHDFKWCDGRKPRDFFMWFSKENTPNPLVPWSAAKSRAGSAMATWAQPMWFILPQWQPILGRLPKILFPQCCGSRGLWPGGP